MEIGYIDFETANATTPIKDGSWRYALTARPIILAVALGASPARAIEGPLSWAALPDLAHHHARVLRGEAVWAAWNAAFDRRIWNQCTDFPPLAPEHIIDPMAQATAAGLPGTLDGAARFAGVGRKTPNAKRLIRLFTVDCATPADHPQ